ncbi:MAG: hypothetical protein AAF533_05495 [Acidobacteriota bacterium]
MGNRASVLMALALFSCSSVFAATGGPDGFGYTWRDGAEPGVDFLWEDITVTGTDITPRGDDINSGLMAISLGIPFYGTVYNQLAVCSNGWISFTDGVETDFGNTVLPNDGVGTPAGMIAGFWDDLDTDPDGNIYFFDAGDHLVVTYALVPHLGGAEPTTFQFLLYPDGRIRVQYLDIQGDRMSSGLGIESPDQAFGLTVFNDEAGGVPPNGYVVEFVPPSPVPVNLDCAAAPMLDCGAVINSDLTMGTANQDRYFCSLNDYAGREEVYTIDPPAGTDVRIVLEASSGNPDLIILDGCDPNACASFPLADEVLLTGVTGPLTLVVDCAPGEEGAYQLRVDCLPLPNDLDCGIPNIVSCGDMLSGDTSTGGGNQSRYECESSNWSGNEDVYLLPLLSPVNLQIDVTSLSGDHQVFVLDSCDPNDCRVAPSDSIFLEDVDTNIYIVVDSPEGQEGAYELTLECLAESFPFCGDGLVEINRYNNGDFAWMVEGWFYHPGDTHSFALRVDDTQVYSHDVGGCDQFPIRSAGAIPPNGPAFVTYEAPEGRVDITLRQVVTGGCCGLQVDMDVTNIDTVPHHYDFRVYHDTAFGDDDGGACGAGGVTDGGPFEVNGTRYTTEQDLIALGSTACEGQVETFSADDPMELWATYRMEGPNLPTDMEMLDWNDGGVPCTTWNGLVDGADVGSCTGDSSILLIWRFPGVAGQLMPGESARATYRVGWKCTFTCVDCEVPMLDTGLGRDFDTCNRGVRIDWEEGFFPGVGEGVYHVYRSETSFADALLQPPLTDMDGIADTFYQDPTTTPGVDYFYVVQAESTEYPGCGAGPSVGGTTAELNIGPVQDEEDSVPPVAVIDDDLRADGGTDTSVHLFWPTAPGLAAGESYTVTRSDRPDGGFVIVDTDVDTDFLDTSAPNGPAPFVWFYRINLVDECGNVGSP